MTKKEPTDEEVAAMFRLDIRNMNKYQKPSDCATWNAFPPGHPDRGIHRQGLRRLFTLSRWRPLDEGDWHRIFDRVFDTVKADRGEEAAKKAKRGRKREPS